MICGDFRFAFCPAPVRLLLLAGFLAGNAAMAQPVRHLTVPQPGGMPGRPVLTGIEQVTNGVRLTWDGVSGYHQVYQKPFVDGTKWQAVGKPNLTGQATITALTSNAFFRVAGPAPRYAGAQACVECHEEVHQAAMNTRHAGAFVNPAFVAKGGQTNSSCLPCHTVGYGLPSGFVSITHAVSTNRLAGVQCENCHGPAADHAANETDPTVLPRVEIAGTMCGGCHNATSHRPHYEQWVASGHAVVTEDMNPANRISSCGRCHSGTSRLALLYDRNPAIAVTNDANLGIACAVCHDPHSDHRHANVLNGVVTNATTGFVVTNSLLGATYTNQLRNPLASTKDYFLSTSESFTAKYDASINICAQCHNHRDASWKSSSRPPHHSPQYNMLLGTVGELGAGSLSATNRWTAGHALIEKQCAGCHMQTEGDGSEAHPEMSGHSFRVESYDSCLACHPLPELLVDFTAETVLVKMQQVKASLDMWATTKAPAPIEHYGTLAWEYDNAGTLSNPAGLDTIHGPHADADAAKDEQKYVPERIKRARFNLYLVLYDGSYGVHNGPLALSLLNAANNWVRQELDSE